MKNILILVMAVFFAASPKAEKKPNILFIAIDDMNDWTGFLGGHPQAITPNMDKLAEEGMNFTNAHCSAPGCSPSRNALLYGIEPFNSGFYPFYNNVDFHNDASKKYTSLPKLFKDNGYNTYGAGKIHHGNYDFDHEWSDYLEMTGVKKEFHSVEGYQIGKSSKMSFRPTTNALEDHFDHKVATYGVDVLKKDHEKPFFLAVGIVKPHLAFDAPKQFFDALPKEIYPPKILENDVDDLTGEARRLSNPRDDKQFKKDKAWERVRKSYLACISWADYNVGRVLGALKASKYADNTIIVLWSDHGYHMGEKQEFRKFTLWEESTRVPFIIRDLRNKKAGKDRKCTQAVSLINIYKTLTDMSGLDVPEYVDGHSLVPQLKDPKAPVQLPAYTTWGRGNYSVRTENWRYNHYFDGSEELYNHAKDQNEWHNLASNPEYSSQKEKMRALLPKNEEPTHKLETATILSGEDRVDVKKLNKK